MSTAERRFDQASELITRTQAEGWGVAFDHNRHGQWRISRVVNYQNYPLVADSDFETACQLALDEVERLLNPPAFQAPPGYAEPYQLVHPQQLAQPQLSAPSWDGHDTN